MGTGRLGNPGIWGLYERMKRIIIFLIISVLILGGCNWTTPPEPTEITYRALFVGAGDYNGCGNDLSAPSYAVDSIKELFTRCYYLEDLTVLKDKEATKENILNEIRYTFKDAKEDDVSIFYFAGHGGYRYFCPTDTNWTIQENITVTELEYLLDKINGTKIVILDCCYSGGFIGKSKLLNKPGYQVLTSCMGEQVCYQMGGFLWVDPYMVFTRGLLEGCKTNYLADIDSDGIITMTEAYNFAVDWVNNNFNREQDAQMYPDGSLFPIVKY